MVKAITPVRVDVLNFDGTREPFDATELQTRLIGCFLAAGRGDSSFMAEDIALAVEYTLSHVDRPESVFGRGEIDAAVIRLLEEAGLPDVAKIFRRGQPETRLLVGASRETLSGLLRGHLACSAERFERVLGELLAAAEKLGINEASPHLWLELARHFERETEDEEPPCPEPMIERTLTKDEILGLLPPEALTLYKAGVLRINGITMLFPCIHFYLSMTCFAAAESLRPPVIELQVEPLLYKLSGVLENVRTILTEKLGAEEPLPCILSIPDMLDFIAEFLAVTDGAEKTAAELGSILSSRVGGELFKISFS